MKFVSKMVSTVSLLIASTAMAQALDPQTMHINLINNTKTDLFYLGFNDQNPGNEISISPEYVHSGQTAVITGKVTRDNDLFARLAFYDEVGLEHDLVILDPQNRHAVLPKFVMRDKLMHSNLQSKIFGAGDPNGLLLSEATVELIG